MMTLSWLRIKPVLMVIVLLTCFIFIAGMILRFATPALSLQPMLWQFRYGLLIWRLGLYAASITLGILLYRRLPLSERPQLKRVAALALVLLAVSEISNALQWGNGV